MTPLPVQTLGILYSLASAIIWGGADFTGGMASRRSHPFQVLSLSAIVGLGVVIAMSLLFHEPLPSLASAFWALLAGIAGALGIVALYRGLVIGQAAMVAPTAAVIGAALATGVGFLAAGLPRATQLTGYGLAIAGLWLVSRSPTTQTGRDRRGLLQAVLAGLGFAAFFVFLAQVDEGPIFTPLIATRCMTVVTALALLRISKQPFPPLASNPLAWLAGFLDSAGNVVYMLATRYTRMDLVVILTSLYPAFTVFLSLWIFKEKISGLQWWGVAVCIAAVILISL